MQQPRDLPLHVLFRSLPRSAELAPVREAVLAESVVDTNRRWRSGAEYATVDDRVIPEAVLDRVFATAEQRSIEHVRSYHRAVRASLKALLTEEPSPAAQLVEQGEAATAAARWEEAISYYGAAAGMAELSGDTAGETWAARRLGLAHLHLGDIDVSLRWYARCRELAEESGDTVNLATAHLGTGHCLCFRGRWTDAEAEYRRALELCPEERRQLRGQTCTNLSMTARERQRPAEAENWLREAEREWEHMQPGDRAVWHNQAGLLCLRREDPQGARSMFETALPLSQSHFDTAMILDNMADVHVRTGALHEAETYARRAEDFAIAAASPRALADIYIRLGVICRVRDDANGVIYFEKALELCRVNGYEFTEAIACLEYSRFRRATGDRDEAEGLRERALDILSRIGSEYLPR